jgi:hypothetical protein
MLVIGSLCAAAAVFWLESTSWVVTAWILAGVTALVAVAGLLQNLLALRNPEGAVRGRWQAGLSDRKHHQPGEAVASATHEGGKREAAVCAGCGRSSSRIESDFAELEKKGVRVFRSPSGPLWHCDRCRKHFCGRCLIEDGMSALCPDCKKVLA